MICPLCHEQHPDNAQFCPTTGKKIIFACPNCGNQVQVGSKFCPYCRTTLDTSGQVGDSYAVPSKPSRFSLWWLLFFVGIGILAILVVVFIVQPSWRESIVGMFGSDSTPPSTQVSADLPEQSPTESLTPTDVPPDDDFVVLPSLDATITATTRPTNTAELPTATPFPTETQPPPIGESLIVFNSNRTGNNEIFIMNSKGKKVEQLTNNPYDDRVPSWSPNGDRIAFQSNRDGDYEIYVLDLSRGSLRQITSNSCNDYAPAWSPDGEKFVYYSECDGNREIFIINANGSNRKQLTTTNDVYNWFPTWSPDGGTITFSSNRSGNYMVYLMNRDGSNVQDLVRGCVSSFSPDGRKILFSSYCTDDGDIYQMNSDGTNVQTVLADYESRNPSWSPDGKSVVFQSNLSGNYDIWSLDLISMGLIRLTDHTAEDSAPVWQISSK